MEKTIVPKGIVRNSPRRNAQDGELQDMVNLRPEDGALRPVGLKESVLTSSSTYGDYKVHTPSENVKVFFRRQFPSSYEAVIYKDGAYLKTQSLTTKILDTSAVTIETMGTMVIVSDGADYMKYFRYDLTDDLYVYTSGIVPYLNFKLDVGTSYNSTVEWEDTSNPQDVFEASVYQAIAEAQSRDDSGTVVGTRYMMYAWKLFDGSIVRPSTLRRFGGSISFAVSGTTQQVSVTSYDVDLESISSDSEITSLLSDWSGIIHSLVIYINPTNDIKVEKVGSTLFGQFVDSYNIKDISSMHLLAEVPLEDLEDLTDSGSITLLTGNMNNLTARETMPFDNYTHTAYSSTKMMAYNHRVWLADVHAKLQDIGLGDEINKTAYQTGYDTYNVKAYIFIRTSDGTKIVEESFNFYTPSGDYTLHSFSSFSYPDNRAFKVEFYAKSDTGSTYFFVGAMNLMRHDYINMAYWQGSMTMSADDYVGQTYPVEDKEYRDENRIQACELENPYYWPTKNSYRVGKGIIVGIATNVVPLSSGQAGQYPIYAFTSEGIWSLALGIESLIETITPISEVVANNPDAILRIKQGVAFTTREGVYVISGLEVVEFSQHAEGEYSHEIINVLDYENSISDANQYQMLSECTMGLKEYVADAKMGYDMEHNEIIFSKGSGAGYSWVFNVENTMWYKISEVFDEFITAYPTMYAYVEDTYEIVDL